MLKIRVIMNSNLEEILDFKCCNLQGQNFEIHLFNPDPEPLMVFNSCELESETETIRLNYLYPPGVRLIPPGETVAFYCALDETIINRFQRIVFQDTRGRRHPAKLSPASQKTISA